MEIKDLAWATQKIEALESIINGTIFPFAFNHTHHQGGASKQGGPIEYVDIQHAPGAATAHAECACPYFL
jgi:hypothetical protein